jgi:hypothetical protein
MDHDVATQKEAGHFSGLKDLLRMDGDVEGARPLSASQNRFPNMNVARSMRNLITKNPHQEAKKKAAFSLLDDCST